MAKPLETDGAPPPVGSSPVIRGRNRIRVVVGAIVLVGVAALSVIFLLTRDSAGKGFQAGDEFTCSDGTFSMTLPDGWIDDTDAYRAEYLEQTGAESGIEGFVTLDGLPPKYTTNMVTMSGHPILTMLPPSGDDLLQDSVSYWAGRFDDLESSVSGGLSTDSGDEVLYTILSGTEGGRGWQVVLAYVMGEDSYAMFILETRRDHDVAKEALLGSLRTLVFHPVDPTEIEVDHEWYLPHDDGRTYSTEGGASVVIPESWTYIGQLWDADALNPTINFDFLGLWQVGGDADDGPFDIVSVSMQVSVDGYPESTAIDQLAVQFGAVGETTTDGAGVRYTVEGLKPWDVPGAEDAAWVRLVADYEATGEPLFDGRIVDQVCYLLIQDTFKIVAFLEFPGSLDETILASFEQTLETIEFRP